MSQTGVHPAKTSLRTVITVVALGVLGFAGAAVADRQCSLKQQFDALSNLRTYSSNLYSARALIARSQQRLDNVAAELYAIDRKNICESLVVTLENIQFAHELLMDSDKYLVTVYAMADYSSLTPDRQQPLQELHAELAELLTHCQDEEFNLSLIDRDLETKLKKITETFNYLTTKNNLTYKVFQRENQALEESAKSCDIKLSLILPESDS